MPAILSPYPYATENHQEKNARAVVGAGAAVLLLDKDLSGARIAGAVEDLRKNPEKLKEMSDRSRALFHEGAARRMAETISAGNRS